MLGAFLLRDSTYEFERWMSANGDVSPSQTKQCADALREWCRACPQLTRGDSDQSNEDTRTGGGAGARPSIAMIPMSPVPDYRHLIEPSASSGNVAGLLGVGLQRDALGGGVATSSISMPVVNNSDVDVGSVSRAATGLQPEPAAASDLSAVVFGRRWKISIWKPTS